MNDITNREYYIKNRDEEDLLLTISEKIGTSLCTLDIIGAEPLNCECYNDDCSICIKTWLNRQDF